MSNDLTIYVVIAATFAIMLRLDRLGKQLEAVCANIKEELAPSEERKMKILKEWQEDQRQQAKDRRQFLIFWGIVAAAAIAWNLISH